MLHLLKVKGALQKDTCDGRQHVYAFFLLLHSICIYIHMLLRLRFISCQQSILISLKSCRSIRVCVVSSYNLESYQKHQPMTHVSEANLSICCLEIFCQWCGPSSFPYFHLSFEVSGEWHSQSTDFGNDGLSASFSLGDFIVWAAL